MTLMKSLVLNLAMLAAAAGILYWAVDNGSAPESEPAPPAMAREADPSGTVEAAAEPEVREAKAAPAPPARPGRTVRFPLDLNTARQEELMSLPGIGEKLAQRMVEYRKLHGGFRSVDDLRNVRGIGEKRMERIRPLVVTAEVR